MQANEEIIAEIINWSKEQEEIIEGLLLTLKDMQRSSVSLSDEAQNLIIANLQSGRVVSFRPIESAALEVFDEITAVVSRITAE